MTDDEIIAKAGSHWQRTRGTMQDYLKMIIKFAREDEREECEYICEVLGKNPVVGCEEAYQTCASTIRARGEK